MLWWWLLAIVEKMIRWLVGFCFVLGLSVAGPLSRKGAYAPAPPGGRPPCATNGMTFCEEVDKYPTKLIQKLLLQSKAFDAHDFFVDESEGLDEPPEYVLHQEMSPTISNKQKNRKIRSPDLAESQLSQKCSVASKMATPKIASNSRGEWRFIAQEEISSFEQKFRVQVCDEREECKKSCTQFFSPVSMVSIDHDGKKVDDIFWMPTSCRCFDETENII